MIGIIGGSGLCELCDLCAGSELGLPLLAAAVARIGEAPLGDACRHALDDAAL